VYASSPLSVFFYSSSCPQHPPLIARLSPSARFVRSSLRAVSPRPSPHFVSPRADRPSPLSSPLSFTCRHRRRRRLRLARVWVAGWLRSGYRLSLSESLPSSALPSVLMWLAGWLPHCAFSRSRPSEPVPSRSHVRTDYPSSPAALWLAGLLATRAFPFPCWLARYTRPVGPSPSMSLSRPPLFRPY
jgi:hypothetical protein